MATRPMVLIDEVGLGEGVVDWSWNASYLLYEPPDGVTAAVDGWGALSVKTETPFSTDWWGASALEMWVSVVDPDVPLAIRLDASDSETSLDAFTISFDEVLKGTQLKPMQWTQLVVPLESLGPHQWDRVSLVVAEDDAQDVLIRVKRLALLPSKYFESRSGSSTISWVLDDGDPDQAPPPPTHHPLLPRLDCRDCRALGVLLCELLGGGGVRCTHGRSVHV